MNKKITFLAALSALTMLAACARNPPQTLEQVWARVEAERQAEQQALVSPIAAQWQEVNIEYLREYRAYPRGYFLGRDIFILTVENNYPVVKRVDIIGGGLTVENEMTLDRISHNIGNYIVLGGTRSFSFNTALNSPHASILFTNNIFRTLGAGGQTNLRFVEKVGQEIPEEIFWRTSDSQLPYVGTFIFDELQIISQRDYEITQERLEWYADVQINISLGPERVLIAELGDSALRFNINPLFHNGGRTVSLGGANGGHGGSFRYLFIADENTIYNRYFSFHHPHDWNTGERLPGGHYIRYAVRYVRQ